LNVPALRQRFGIEAADLPLLQHWIGEANIRWGLNSEHRQALGLHSTENPAPNTWQFGLQRMLLGYAVGSDTTGRSDNAWHDIEPYADIAGLDAALLGPLSQFYHALDNLFPALSKPQTPTAWADCLLQLLQDFFQVTNAEERSLLLQLQESVQTWLEACCDAQFDEPVPITVVRDYWLGQVDQGRLSQRFLGGSLTFATLMPMRAIPFRRIYLLGMNDGAYPRIMPPLDFDLMAGDYRPGDRSRREDDRYLFLEALLSARDQLSISWVGRDIHDNSERQPSVLVSQLRDHLRNGWRLADSEDPDRLLKALTVQHCLQPFSEAYFDGRDKRLFTYAREWRTASSSPSPFVEHELAAPVFDAPLSLFALASFLRDPAKTFLRERLGVNFDVQDLATEDQEPFALNPLENWALQDELIRTRLDAKQLGLNETEAVQRQVTRFQRQGILSGGAFGPIQQQQLQEPLDKLFEAYVEACQKWPHRLPALEIAFSHDVDSQTLHVQDSLGDLFENLAGERCRLQIVSSNLLENNRYRLDKVLPAWVFHVAGHVSGQPLTTVLISKNGTVTIKPLEPEDAKQYLHALLQAYVTGFRTPTPLAVKTGFAWLSKQSDSVQGPLEQCDPKAAETARQAYEGTYKSKGEMGHNPYLQRLFPSFEALWRDGEFSQACVQLLKPLRDCVGESGKSKPGKSGDDQ
jgi:exodeoxyribonuclease V gamma subunit